MATPDMDSADNNVNIAMNISVFTKEQPDDFYVLFSKDYYYSAE